MTQHLEESYPLTPMQMGMLMHSLYSRDSGMYINQIIAQLNEEIAVEEFQRAWQLTTDHNAILRTGFEMTPSGEPLQHVYANVPVSFRFEDWSPNSSSQQDEQLSLFLRSDRREGFDAEQPPLLRISLFRIAAGNFRMVLTNHHILLDGHATFLLLKQALEAYDSLCAGETPQLPVTPPYRDYVEWLAEQNTDADEPYWRDVLGGFSRPTELTSHEELPAANSAGPVYAATEARLSSKTGHKLAALAAEHKITISTIAQGAWAFLLAQYSGGDEAVFGTVREGRKFTIKDADSIAGLCINTQPMRVTIAKDKSVIDWLKRIRQQQISVRPHRLTPLDLIQPCCDVPGGQPLFQTTLNYLKQPWNFNLEKLGGRWQNRKLSVRNQAEYLLSVDVYETDALYLKTEYDANRVSEDYVEQILRQYQTILTRIADNPRQQVKELSMLTDSERVSEYVDWAVVNSGLPVHELFAAQVARTPDGIAASLEDSQMSYRELNSRANQVAHRLLKLGLRPEEPVGVCFEHSPEMLVAILAVLKAGAAYVPLDPAYPVERLAFIVKDSGVKLILSTSSLSNKLHEDEALPSKTATVISLDSAASDIAHESTQNPTTTVTQDNLAYVIYTSGSTGTPKGVMVPHRGLTNYLTWATACYKVEQGCGAPLYSSLSFDFTITSLFLPLISGGTVMLIPESGGIDALAQKLREDLEFSFIKLTPAHLEVLSQMLAAGKPLLNLHRIIIGGDALWSGVLAAWKVFAPNAVFINEYGPTEASVGCCVYETRQANEGRQRVPIGRPISNVQLFLLDASLQPVASGVVGEIYIGGDGLARGYLGRPELTDAMFISNPLDTSATRLYKTGDLAYRRPDGNLVYLGRSDFQVKVRGYRIEPGEVESALRAHAGVGETIVVSGGQMESIQNSHEHSLLAYYVPKPDSKVNLRELRSFLTGKLPAYMIPSVFIALDRLPLTANGKIDISSLPDPEHAKKTKSDNTQPGNPTEDKLSQIWASVLAMKAIGVDANFFELGGHSLLMVQVASRIRRDFGVQLPIRSFFEAPTIAGMASVITQLQTEDKGTANLQDLLAKIEQMTEEEVKAKLEQNAP